MKEHRAFNICATAVSLIIAACPVVLMSGCGITKRDLIQYHTFDYPIESTRTKTVSDDTLMIYRFLLSPKVDSHYLTITKDQARPSTRRLHRWSRSPGDMITDLVLRDVRKAGLVKKAVDQSSNALYRYLLEGTISMLGGLKTEKATFAVIRADVAVTDFDAPIGADKTILEERYEIKIPCPDPKPETVAAKLNEAVRIFSKKLRSDLKAVLAEGSGQNDTKPRPKVNKPLEA
jgi:ABC-type uncharacterized transport system auxiliary subunit